jgi:hypothetical protein
MRVSHFEVGAWLIVGAAVAMSVTSAYYTRHYAVAYRLNGYYAVYCLMLATGMRLIENSWIQYVAVALAAYFVWSWWVGGGGRDIQGYFGLARAKVESSSGTASAKR